MEELKTIDDNIIYSKRFLTGLEKNNITIKELKNDWFYQGGEIGSHLNYYKLVNGATCDLPEHSIFCICGHKIKYNCFIGNGDRVLPVGNCCIKRFIPNNKRSCSDCGIKHRNRKDNKCNICRRKFTKSYVSNILSFN